MEVCHGPSDKPVWTITALALAAAASLAAAYEYKQEWALLQQVYPETKSELAQHLSRDVSHRTAIHTGQEHGPDGWT